MKLFCGLLIVNEGELGKFQHGLRFRGEKGEGVVEGLALSGWGRNRKRAPPLGISVPWFLLPGRRRWLESLRCSRAGK
ncbi:MAG: hypothetical protein BHW66_00575 [Akkermansia sp. 54_46]|nr:MAG: hypothetical protein BHW66_00575 [Akkermansia sp. 54_46]PNC74344.1 hypothetical protein CXU04_00040 [Akkermansia muciniphila]PNC86697.1 hypothetical protein CXU03_10425 [Akkermansia muciniphila]QHV10266.1 hypothetical protein C5N96_11135 [Akkermansia muciniphila]